MVDIVERLHYAGYNDGRLAEAANEIERLREGLKIASVAVESLHLECDRHRQAANEHRNAAMEADQRTMAAVRGEKRALGDADLLRAALVAAEKAIQEAAADMVGYCGKDPEQLAEPLRRAADARIAVRAALTPNVELRGGPAGSSPERPA